MALCLAVTLVPSLLLVALGWLLFQQDRESEAQQLEDRRNQAVDLVVAELERHLSETARALGDPRARRALVTTDDSAVVRMAAGGTDVFPAGRLAYVPAPQTGREADETVFSTGERLEHRQGDSSGAVRVVARR
jgi:hypothetical protein